jgi:hypothetical protein
VVYFAYTVFSKIQICCQRFSYKKLGFEVHLKKLEHLALLHPNFSIATISWNCWSQPNGAQP